MRRRTTGVVFALVFGLGLPQAMARGWGAGVPSATPTPTDAQTPAPPPTVQPASGPAPAPGPDYPPPQWPLPPAPAPAPYYLPPQPGPPSPAPYYPPPTQWGPPPAMALAAPAALARSGRFHRGIGLELLGVGPAYTFTRFGSGVGAAVTTAVQLDLGTHWALRIPISADSTVRARDVAYVGLAFSPGLVYRWRTFNDERWIPYCGAGVRMAASGVRRDFIGEPLVPTTTTIGALHLHDLDDHHGSIFGSHHDDPNVDTLGTIGPELWAGTEFHPSRWVAVIFGATYAWMRINSENVHLLRGTVAFRATL